MSQTAAAARFTKVVEYRDASPPPLARRPTSPGSSLGRHATTVKRAEGDTMDRTEDMVRAAAEQEMVPAQEPLDDAGYGFDAAAHGPGEPAMSEHNVTGGPAPVAYLFAGQASALLICPACRAAYVRDEAPLEALASLKDAPPEAELRCALCKVSLSPDRPGPKP